MLEWWNHGMLQERQHSSDPSFHYSSIPSFHFYSHLNATMGSILAARRAGR